jgi:spore maturation protein CgeB
LQEAAQEKSAQIDSATSRSTAPTTRPLRMLQIFTSYEESILQLYKAQPGLSLRPFDEQVDALVQDGFNAAHILAPALRAHGFETGVIVANSRPAQEKWLTEHKVLVPISRDWVKEITRAQIAFYQPDIVYTNDPLTFEAGFINSLPFRPRLMVGWRAAPIPGGISWAGYDLMVSNISGCREIMLALGAASVAPHNPGFPRWLAEKLVSQPHQTDVVFAGSLTKGHQRRVEYVDFLARSTIDQANHGRRFSSEFYVGGDPQFIPPAVRSLNRGDLFGRRYFEALRRGRIVLDIRGSAITLHDPVSGKHYDMAGTESGSMRLFEGTGCGSLLLTDHHAGLSRYFEVGKEIVSFSDERDMLEKIAFYAAHPEQAEVIAQAGHARCMRDHSVEKHAQRFAELLRASLEGLEFPGLVRAGQR